MTDLAPGSSVSIESPQVSLDVYSPHFVNGVLVTEGPRGADSTVPGPANELTIGTVTGGDTAAATITGEAPNQVLNLVLPKGDPSTVPGPGVPAGGTAGQALVKKSGADYDTEWATSASGGGSTPLAYVSYRPGTTTVLSTTSTAPVDADATNLVATFTAPASGSVIIRLVGAELGTASYFRYWGLRQGSTLVSGSDALVGGNGQVNRTTHSARITGLTPGNTYTWKWAFWVSDSGIANIQVGGDRGATIMEVWSV